MTGRASTQEQATERTASSESKRRPAPNPVVVAPFWRRCPALTAGAVTLLVIAWVSPRPKPPADEIRYHNRTATIVKVLAPNQVEIDLPDGAHPTTVTRLWGIRQNGSTSQDAAIARIRDRLLHQRVTLLLAPQRSRDDAGRLLAYLIAENNDATVNEWLLEQGDAAIDATLDHPLAASFEALVRQARSANR